MSVLKRNNILFNWLLAYVGVDNNWLSASDVLKEIDPNELNKLDENMIAELYIAADDSKQDFLNKINLIFQFSEDEKNIGLWIWSIAFLNDVMKSAKSLSDKLRDIENIWSMVGYPDNWKPFIYYMPVGNDEATGEDIVYKKFTGYLNNENHNLKKLGYLS